MLPVSWRDNCLPVQCRLGRHCSGRIFLPQGGNAARFCLTQGANAVRFFVFGSFVVFCPFFFQSSTFLSLRFVGVVASEFFFRLRVVYRIDSARFFMGIPIVFASRKFFWKFRLSYPCFLEVPPRKNFGERASGKIFGSELWDFDGLFFACAIAC